MSFLLKIMKKNASDMTTFSNGKSWGYKFFALSLKFYNGQLTLPIPQTYQKKVRGYRIEIL